MESRSGSHHPLHRSKHWRSKCSLPPWPSSTAPPSPWSSCWPPARCWASPPAPRSSRLRAHGVRTTRSGPGHHGEGAAAGIGVVEGLGMRALGPGSVSSFLKIILDVVYFALWVGLAILAVVTLVALLFSFNPGLFSSVRLDGDDGDIAGRAPLMTAALIAYALSLAGVQVIVHSLRRIFTTLTAGDPFHPDNVNRLRLIGLMLAALEL